MRRHRPAPALVLSSVLTLAAATAAAAVPAPAPSPAPAAVPAAGDRVRLGSDADVSRAEWSGPAFTMNGSGEVVPGSMREAVETISGGEGAIDVVVLAASEGDSDSPTP